MSVAFDAFEHQKENIQPLRGGRSVLALSKTFEETSPVALKTKLEQQRRAFEDELTHVDELDDPLDVWTRYIQWVNETFTTGHNTESGLIPILERCTTSLRGQKHYQNDPRYLKIWLQYIKNRDNPREIFVHLARNGIGNDLATFYEEYASYLEANGRRIQADEIYQMGILKSARPIERLRRRYEEFTERLRATPLSTEEPTSPALPLVRPALAPKFETSTSVDMPADPSGLAPAPPRSRLQVFEDPENHEVERIGPGGWDAISSASNQKKENIQEARSWAGEKLEQETQVGGVNRERLVVYRDQVELKFPSAPAKFNGKGKTERTAVKLELIYPRGSEEYSLEELRAQAKGHLSRRWPNSPTNRQNLLNETTTTPIKGGFVKLFTNADSPVRRRRKAPSPTINTKAALADIFDIFNKPLKCDKGSDDEQSAEEDDQYAQFTQTFTIDEKDETTAVTINEESVTVSIKPDTITNNESTPATPATPAQELISNEKRAFDLMTPITEKTETVQTSTFHEETTQSYHECLDSSPFQEQVEAPRPIVKQAAEIKQPFFVTTHIKTPIIDETICNPMDSMIRKQLMIRLQSRLQNTPGYFSQQKYNYEKFDLAQKYSKSLSRKVGDTTETLQEFFLHFDGGSSFTIKRKLGEGAFAPVFLVENTLENLKPGRARLEAIKIERPPSPLEFYVIREAQQRLRDKRALESIVNVSEMHHYRDEGYMVLEYSQQGTVLDLINSVGANGLEENLVMFFAIELLRSIEQLHEEGIIHGDLKSDNCLIRLDGTLDREWSSQYMADGSQGWSHKGLTLIDFGRAIDMKLFPSNVQFIADWKMDQQDCAEMREARPWTFQVDYYGVAAIIHLMLFGKYIETIATRGDLGKKSYRIGTSLKRYWQVEIWKDVFDLLLNPLSHVSTTDLGKLPINESLKECRKRMEDWVSSNCKKGVGLKSMIKKLEGQIRDRKPI